MNTPISIRRMCQSERARARRTRRFVHIGLATMSAMFVTAGAVLTTSVPAFADSTIIPWGSASVQVGSTGDFSYTLAGQQMARNVNVSAALFAPMQPVSVRWHDATTNGPWSSPVSAVSYEDGTYGYPIASTTLSGIPASSCGDTIEVSASGETGTWPSSTVQWPLNYSTLVPTSIDFTIVEDCGPAIAAVSNASGTTTFFGDGFGAGQAVWVWVSGPSGDVMAPTEVKASTEQKALRCFGGMTGIHCMTVVKVPPGDVSVTASSAFVCGDTVDAGFPHLEIIGFQIRQVWSVLASATAGCIE
jgi:hypothetical protein